MLALACAVAAFVGVACGDRDVAGPALPWSFEIADGGTVNPCGLLGGTGDVATTLIVGVREDDAGEPVGLSLTIGTLEPFHQHRSVLYELPVGADCPAVRLEPHWEDGMMLDVWTWDDGVIPLPSRDVRLVAIAFGAGEVPDRLPCGTAGCLDLPDHAAAMSGVVLVDASVR